MIPIKKLKLNPVNPRRIDRDKLELLKKSIQDFERMMELRPIVVDDDYTILGGNMRLQAIKQLGYKEIPDEWVKVAEGLTEEEKKEFVIKDNVGFGGWDWDILGNEWDAEELTDWGLDVPGWGKQVEAVEDDYEIPDEVKTDIVPGDLIEIGEHRLLCGDSANSGDVDRLMNGAKADMVFTDPPYGVAIGAKNRMLNSFQKAGRNLTDIKDDALSPDKLKEVLLPAFSNLQLAMKPCCTVFVTAPQGGEPFGMMMMTMKESGLPVRHVLIWKKNAPTFSMGRLDYDYQHEPILLTWNKTHKFYGGGRFKTSIWEIDKPMKSKEHPTMKPVALVENALLNNSKEGDVVIDWFIGSGTTMVAAHQLGRKCYGMEIDPKYCQVIIDRMRKLDPNINVRINGKEYL